MNVDASLSLGVSSYVPQTANPADTLAAAGSQAADGGVSSVDTLDSGQPLLASLNQIVARSDLDPATAPGEDDTYRIRIVNPGLTANAQGHAQYGVVQGALFGAQPNSAMFGDPDQGRTGDCYFVQAMSAIAYKHPGFIKNAMHRNDDGTVTVRLYAKDPGSNAMHPVEVTVGPELPLSNVTGKPFYTRSAAPNELWPAYMEKAFAALQQFETRQPGYTAIGSGGTPGQAFAALTGVQSHRLYNLRDEKPSVGEAYSAIAQALNSGQYVTAGSPAQVTTPGLVPDHAYSVLGVHTEGDHAYVTLRNPWGHHEPGNDGTDDGIFNLTMRQFLDDYAGVFVSGATASRPASSAQVAAIAAQPQVESAA